MMAARNTEVKQMQILNSTKKFNELESNSHPIEISYTFQFPCNTKHDKEMF